MKQRTLEQLKRAPVDRKLAWVVVGAGAAMLASSLVERSLSDGQGAARLIHCNDH